MRLLLTRYLPLAILLSACLYAPAQLVLSSNLVQVGVVVSDGKGPVRGLKAEDFVVLDNGKPRNVRVLLEQLSGVAVPQAIVVKNTFSNSLPADTGVAQGPSQRTGTPTIILLDSLNSLYGSMPANQYEAAPNWVEDLAIANAKQRLIAALKHIDLRNPVAAYGLGTSLKMLCDFTCSREQLLEAVKRFDPTDRTSRETVEPGEIEIPGQIQFSEAINRRNQSNAADLNRHRGQDTMSALRTIAARVSAIPGRKNLLWFTSNLPFSGEAIARIVTPAKIAIYPVDGRGLLTGGPEGAPPPPQIRKGLDSWAADSPEPIGI